LPGVRLAVAAPPALVRELTAGLAHAVPGGFTILTVPSQQAVTGDVAPPVTIVTAGAAGTSQQQAITTALTAAAHALHRPARSLDAVPLASIGLFLLGRRLRLWWRVTAAFLFSLLTGCGSVLALDAIYGALTGSSAALLGVGFLGSLTFVAFVTAAQAVTGLPGTALGALVFVVIGNAVSGGTVPFAFLPDGFRQLAASLAVLAAIDLFHLAERRHAPGQAADIYATPGTTHLRQRHARRQAAAPQTAAGRERRGLFTPVGARPDDAG
jgi:hypothetical protein